MMELRNRRGARSDWWFRLLALALLTAALFAVLALGTEGVAFGASRQKTQSAGQDRAVARVFDQASLFSAQEKDSLEELTAQCRKATGMDVVILTAYNDGRRSAEEYADDFYDNGGFGTGKKASGALFLIYMDYPGSKDGDYWISTSGNMIRILTDQRIREMGGDAAGYLKAQDYAGAAQAFLKDIKYYVNKGIESGQYNYNTETGEISVHRRIRWYEALFALAVSGLAAGSVCLGVKREYAMKPTARQQENELLAYRANAQCAMNVVQDTLLNQFVTNARISSAVGRGGGGRGGGSGCSSTHTSSGGSSHGGGGGRF